MNHAGTAAPGCPVERSSTGSSPSKKADLRSAGQPGAAVPTWFVADDIMHQQGCN